MADTTSSSDHLGGQDDSSRDPTDHPSEARLPANQANLEVPEFYGDSAAMDSMTGIAAPLLAGAAVAITGVVVQQPDSLRWPGSTLIFLVISASLLVTSIQFGFLARRHAVTPAQIAEWWPNLGGDALNQRVRRDRQDNAPLLAFWTSFAGTTYDLGIVTLWIGICTAVAPGETVAQAELRWIAAGMAAAVALAEAIWHLASRFWPQWQAPRAWARRRYYSS